VPAFAEYEGTNACGSVPKLARVKVCALMRGNQGKGRWQRVGVLEVVCAEVELRSERGGDR
jgi:hypothetical protein